LARAVAMSDAVSLRVVPSWPMEMHTRSTRPHYRRSNMVTRGDVLLTFLVELFVASEVPSKADLEDDEGAFHAVKRVDV